MKKIFIVIFLLNISFLFGYDLRGYWGLNILTPEKINYNTEKVSWGTVKNFDMEDGFLIDINDNMRYINFTRWGKIIIDEMIESEESIKINFKWKDKTSYIEFIVLNEHEIYIKTFKALFNFPNGLNNRFFKLDGPKNSIFYPLLGRNLKKQNLTWCGSYLGIMPENIIVTIISISNTSEIMDSPDKKELIIRVNENDLIDFNNNYYKKYNLEREDSYVYGEINLNDIKIRDNVIIY